MTTHITREYPRTCHFCGDTFISKHPAARFCSSRCRQRMFRWRKRILFIQRECLSYIHEFEPYLRFSDSRAHTVELMKDIKLVIDAIWRENNIKVVR